MIPGTWFDKLTNRPGMTVWTAVYDMGVPVMSVRYRISIASP